VPDVLGGDPLKIGKSDDGLRSLIQSHLPLVHWSAIETGATARGVPDLEGHVPGHLAGGQGVQLWIECKATRDGRTPKFTPAQPGWLMRRSRAGGICWVACRRRTRSGGDDLLLWPGALVTELIDAGIAGCPPVASWAGGPGQWAWDEFLAVVVGPCD
jgi:hypothetical protein